MSIDAASRMALENGTIIVPSMSQLFYLTSMFWTSGGGAALLADMNKKVAAVSATVLLS